MVRLRRFARLAVPRRPAPPCALPQLTSLPVSIVPPCTRSLASTAGGLSIKADISPEVSILAGGKRVPSAKIVQLADDICGLSVLESVDLNNLLKARGRPGGGHAVIARTHVCARACKRRSGSGCQTLT